MPVWGILELCFGPSASFSYGSWMLVLVISKISPLEQFPWYLLGLLKVDCPTLACASSPHLPPVHCQFPGKAFFPNIFLIFNSRMGERVPSSHDGTSTCKCQVIIWHPSNTICFWPLFSWNHCCLCDFLCELKPSQYLFPVSSWEKPGV